MLAISQRHGDHSRAINTFPGNLFFYVWHFKEDPLCYLLEYPNTKDWLTCKMTFRSYRCGPVSKCSVFTAILASDSLAREICECNILLIMSLYRHLSIPKR